MKPNRTGLNRIFYAFIYSKEGLKSAWKSEAAFRQETELVFCLTLISFFIDVSIVERTMMIGSLVLVVIVELINSAIEATIDRFGPEWHELSRKAKDIGSAAVFVSLALSAFVWLSLLIGKL